MEAEKFVVHARIDIQTLETWVEAGWLVPGHVEGRVHYSDVDLARAHLINDLTGLGVNEAGVPIVLDLVLLLDLAKRTSELRSLGIQEWLSFYFKSPMTAPGLYPEHDLFIQLMKLKNTLRHLKGEELITHLGLEYYD